MHKPLPDWATLLEEAYAQLAAPGVAVQSARLDAQVLLAHVAGVARAVVLAHGERSLPEPVLQQFRALLARRVAGEPLAYVLGDKEFWSLRLRVARGVLVPRPETELLVERCLALIRSATASVADLGTGSGAIALALASERPGWSIAATDLSPVALHLARSNAAGNAANLAGARLEFLPGNWYDAVHGRRFDAIVSNPPYVAAGDPALAALQWEPQQALVAGASGLEALAALIAGAPEHLLPGGSLLLEHGAAQAAQVAAMLVARGFARVRCHRDLAGLDRVTDAQWPATNAEEQTHGPI